MPISSTDLPFWTTDYLTFTNATGSPVASNNSLIYAQLSAIAVWSERFCGKDLTTTTNAASNGTANSATTYTDLYDGQNVSNIMVRQVPVISLTSVSIVSPDNTITALPTTSYRINLYTGRIDLTPSLPDNPYGYTAYAGAGYWDGWAGNYVYFPRGFQNVQVVYTYGYQNYSQIPLSYKMAMFKALDLTLGSIGIRNANDQGTSNASIEDEYERLFMPYRSEWVS